VPGKLIYSAICSLDLFHEDESGDFSWSAPDEEVHAAVNELSRRVGTFLLGRRMYEVLAVWDDDETIEGEPEVAHEFARIWRDADKVVYSRELKEPKTARTTIEREFDPEAVRAMKESADRDLSVAGPGLAAQALEAGLVDEVHLILNPIVVGGGVPVFPSGVRFELELLDERRFGNGVVHLHHAVKPADD
jgi:dihydrofolate reductase